MPTWNDVRLELERTRLPNGNPDFDTVRRGKIRDLATHTGRPLLVYASDFLNQPKMAMAGQEINLDLRDKDGFLECIQRIPGEALDVLVHSPGGLAEAAESIVKILRHRFRDIRFIVPSIAKSAATMLVLSGNQIVMDTQSELGPTDPQFFIPRGDGTVVFAPAQAIIDQFEKAEAVLKTDPKRLPAWIPILPLYGPALYQQCKNAISLSKRLVKQWLASYMFGELPRRRANGAATRISNFFANHNNFLTHLRRVDVDEMIRLGATVHDMRNDAPLQSRVHALYFAIVHTFDGTGAFKIIENSVGDAYVRNIAVPPIPPGMMLQVRPVPAPAAPPQQPPPQQS
jgi:Serine dehydrogenase proteinase